MADNIILSGISYFLNSENLLPFLRGRGGRGEFRRARACLSGRQAFRRSACPPKPRRRREAEAGSSVQKMFERGCIIPPISNFPIFARPIRSPPERAGEGKPG